MVEYHSLAFTLERDQAAVCAAKGQTADKRGFSVGTIYSVKELEQMIEVFFIRGSLPGKTC